MNHIYMQKTKKFNTIITEFLFPFSFEKKEGMQKALLPSLLVYTNQKYPVEENFRKEISKRSIFTLNASIKEIGKQSFLSFIMVTPDKKTIKEDVYPKALSFFLETIYHPNIKNGKFKQTLWEREKKELKKDIESVPYTISAYHHFQIWDFIDPKEEYYVRPIKHKEKLDTLTNKEMYEFYQKIVSHKRPIVFVYGDFIKKDIQKEIENHFTKEKVIFPKDFHPIYQDLFTKTIKKEIKVQERKPFYQSYLTYVYQIKDAKKEDVIYLKCIHKMLSSDATHLLLQKLRNELGIVYSAFSKIAGEGTLLSITAKIDKKNKEKAEKGIEEIMEMLKNPSTVESLLQKVKEEMSVWLWEEEDSKFSCFYNFIRQSLRAGKTSREWKKEIDALQTEDIITFMPRLTKIVHYFLEGETHE